MENRYFKVEDSLFDITEKYPETLNVLLAQGFSQIAEESKRKTFGKSITLKVAATIKQISITSLEELLVEAIDQTRNNADKESVKGEIKGDKDIRIEGLLPCPVRLPLVEKLDAFLESFKDESGYEVETSLQAASMGLDSIKDYVRSANDSSELSDIFLSAGFDLFFEADLMGKFMKQDVFKDFADYDKYNKDFENDYLSLRDPKGYYSTIAAVPAVFLVNKGELKGREVPMTWQDVLKPEFENSISLPVSDFDLFNAMLLHIQKEYGDEGVVSLGRNLLRSMHPAEMVKSERSKTEKPVVTIMPYFFTKMVKPGSSMIAVWPKDGAIISPIFMLTKGEKREQIKPIADVFMSKEIGELLSHQGLFPSVHPEVDNKLPAENKFMWVGWDYIYNNDIGALIEHCETLFNNAIK
ncbi:MAG: ABC transporter substrate-binding protein [Bacteroidales bacterium]|jgi:ABC-type Fe3+ transport system substrate-binding protein|nr:ABC transporter substrate-binding protein [Bacteroidales bacterium]